MCVINLHNIVLLNNFFINSYFFRFKWRNDLASNVNGHDVKEFTECFNFFLVDFNLFSHFSGIVLVLEQCANSLFTGSNCLSVVLCTLLLFLGFGYVCLHSVFNSEGIVHSFNIKYFSFNPMEDIKIRIF